MKRKWPYSLYTETSLVQRKVSLENEIEELHQLRRNLLDILVDKVAELEDVDYALPRDKS